MDPGAAHLRVRRVIDHGHINEDGSGTWTSPDHLRNHLEVAHQRLAAWGWDELPRIHAALHRDGDMAQPARDDTAQIGAQDQALKSNLPATPSETAMVVRTPPRRSRWGRPWGRR